MLWIIRNLLAKIGIRRIASVMYNDGAARPGTIVGESHKLYAIKALVVLGITYQRRRVAWVSKDDPAIVWMFWPTRFKALATVVAFALLVTPMVMNWPTADWGTTTHDVTTGLPLMGTIWDTPLPDGQYTVFKVFPSGPVVVVQHKAGPDRNFAYQVLDWRRSNMPEQFMSGTTFRIFQGKPHLT